MKTSVLIGGGAAGVFAAIQCKEKDPSSRVILLEKTNQWLSKVRISGGGRCNVTHACFDPAHLIRNYPRGSKELLGPFHTFQPKDTLSWFEKRGVLLKVEEDGRMFPRSDSSETIIDCLLSAANIARVEMRKQQSIRSIEKKEGKFFIELANEVLISDQLLLATGSSSFGYELAKQFGHQIIAAVPSLFTFNIPSSPLLDLTGVSLPHVKLSFKEFKIEKEGPLLLTHWGFSGPAALKLSAWAARDLHSCDYKTTLWVNWTASESIEQLHAFLLEQKHRFPHQSLPLLVPKQLMQRLASSLEIDPSTPLGKLSHKKILALAAKLHADPYQIEGKTTYKQEFVTAGGVDLKEICFKTMESKVTKNLFFAGEILNIDGVTGGFNFQNAWTTGYLAGNAIGNRQKGEIC
ncbi:MAG: NAD(P)/FAD-dependent oxidoreductase [Chlamydiae bacterium]|nr:NAD(P)/FAD-dependent oxidoreductase [Chlamydiota bacterium]